MIGGRISGRFFKITFVGVRLGDDLRDKQDE